MKHFLLFLLMTSSVILSAATVTWDGGAGTPNWADAMNWDTDALPTASDDVDITDAVVTLGINATVQRVNVGGSGDFTVLDGFTLTITGFSGDAGLELGGSTMMTNNGTIDISNITGISDDNPNGIHSRNIFNNNGVITIDNTSKHGLHMFGGTFTNAAGASIAIANTGAPVSGSDYINMDNDSGDGSIATFDNNGTVTVTMSMGNDDGLYVTDGCVFNNFNVVDVTASGTTVDNGLRLNNGAAFNNKPGASLSIGSTPDDQLFLDGSGSNFNNEGTVTLTGGLDVGLYVTDASTFTNVTAASMVMVTGAVNHNIQIDANNSTGKIVNNGTIETSGGSQDGIRLQEGGALENNAIITVTSPAKDGINIQSTGGTVTNDGDGTINLISTAEKGIEMNGGTITNNADIGIPNSGREGIEVNGGTITNNADINVSGSGREGLELNNGTFDNVTPGESQFSNSQTKGLEVNDGTLNNTGMIIVSVPEDEGLHVLGGMANNQSGGLIKIDDGLNKAVEVEGGTLNNGGNIEISAPAEEGMDVLSGTFNNLNGGLLQVVDSPDDGLEINSGIVNNDGDFRFYNSASEGVENFGGNTTFVNTANATFSPATSLTESIGELELKGDMDLGASTTTFEIRGTAAATEYDLLDHFSPSSKMSSLVISNANAVLDWGAFVPSPGDEFKIVDGSGTVSGEFASVTSSNPAIDYTVDYSEPTEVVIRIAELLPVELTVFRGELLPKGASLLEWETATEIDNDYFDLEYSTNGQDFAFLSRIEGNGNTSTTSRYNFEHSNLLGEMNYYRLKQVDFDGTSTYSSVIVLRQELVAGQGLVYPNPARDEVVYVGAEATLTFFNAYGQLIKQVTAASGSQTINVSDLPAGTYLLEIVNADDTREVKRLVKSE